MNKKCLHGYQSKEEIQQHFCESEESMKICNNCKFLQYENGMMSCSKGDESE